MLKYLPILLIASCALDASTNVYVAPSAKRALPNVLSAAYVLNQALGLEAFEVRLAPSESRVNGSIIVRLIDVNHFGCDPKGCIIGTCQQTSKGVIVKLTRGARALDIAHELGHATGLRHSLDPQNLMFYAAEHGNLTEDQKAKMLEAD
jgi:hypothetical protein